MLIIVVMLIIMLWLDFKQIRFILDDPDTKELFLKIWNYIKDWRTFVSFLIAWNITNGWCYFFIIIGTWLKIKWMKITGWSYLAFLWLPTTPEKLITVPLGMAIKKLLFKKY